MKTAFATDFTRIQPFSQRSPAARRKIAQAVAALTGRTAGASAAPRWFVGRRHLIQHEAAHAAMARVFGWHIRSVMVTPTRAETRCQPVDDGQFPRERRLEEAAVVLAGQLAAGRRLLGDDADNAKLRELIHDRREREHVETETLRMLEHPTVQKFYNRLVEALHDAETLEGDQLRELLDR